MNKKLRVHATCCFFLAKMEEGFKLPLPKDFVVKNSETAIRKVYRKRDWLEKFGMTSRLRIFSRTQKQKIL